MATTFKNLGEAVRQALEDAETVLAEHWEDRRIPVDCIEIASRLGVDVYQADLTSRNIDGALRMRSGARPRVLVDTAHAYSRKRFTIAHELGHYWLHRGDVDLDRVDYRSNLSSEGVDPEEVYANNFAAALLMPEEELREAWADHRDSAFSAISLAGTFKVSEAAMQHRLDRLKRMGLLSEA